MANKAVTSSFALSFAVLTNILIQHTHCNFDATVSCQPCTVSCGFTSCYRIVADGFDEQACGSQSCNLATSYTQSFVSCSYDLQGTACSSQVCKLPPNSGCAQRILSYNSCSAQIAWNKISCGACLTSTCYSCLFLQDSSTTSATETCLGGGCNKIQPINISYSSCTADSAGNQCSCCYQFNSTIVNQAYICTSNDNIFSASGFSSYAQSKLYENVGKATNLAVLSILFVVLSDSLNLDKKENKNGDKESKQQNNILQ